MASSFTSLPLVIATLLIVTVHLVPAAPIPSEQQDISDFSNSAKGPLSNVFLPFRDLPERLIDNFNSRELDDDRDLTSESDIFYFFGKAPVLTDGSDSRKRGGF